MASPPVTPLRAGLAGLALGAVWGVVARAWMRLVSTSPEFSWSGTLMLVGLSAIVGLLVGLSWRARYATGRRRLFRLLFVPGLHPVCRTGGTTRAGIARRRAAAAPARAVGSAAAPSSRSSGRARCIWWSERPGRGDDARCAAARAGWPACSECLCWQRHWLLPDTWSWGRWGCRLTRCRLTVPAAADAATPVSRCPRALPDPRPPTRRGRTPPRRGCSPGGTVRCRPRGRGSAG